MIATSPEIHFDSRLDELFAEDEGALSGVHLNADAQVLGEALGERGVSEAVTRSLHIHFVLDREQYYMALKANQRHIPSFRHVLVDIGMLEALSTDEMRDPTTQNSIEDDINTTTLTCALASACLVQQSAITHDIQKGSLLRQETATSGSAAPLALAASIYANLIPATFGAPTATRTILGVAIGGMTYLYLNRDEQQHTKERPSPPIRAIRTDIDPTKPIPRVVTLR